MPSFARATPFLLLSYFLGIVVLGSFLAPLFWWGGMIALQWEWVENIEFLRGNLAKSGFDRYFRRALLLAAIILAIPVWKMLEVKREDWQLSSRGKRGWLEFALGFVFAAGLLLSLGLVEVKLGLYLWREGNNGLAWGKLFDSLLAGVAVGILEEWFFRALLFGLLLRALSPLKAAIFVTVLFALLHFFVPPEGLALVPQGHENLTKGQLSDLPTTQVQWWTGFWLTAITFANVSDPTWWLLLAAEFGTLLAVGTVLVVARIKTGALWLGVGLHAGWVFGLKWFSASTTGSDALKQGDWLPWVGENLKVGLFPLLIVTFTGWLVIRFFVIPLKTKKTSAVRYLS